MMRSLLALPMLLIGAAGPPNAFLNAVPLQNFSATTDSKSSARPADGYTAAPTPNQDVVPPTPAKPSSDAALGPGFFKRQDQTRGDGYLPSSSIQSEQQSRAKPGAGISLSMPLQ